MESAEPAIGQQDARQHFAHRGEHGGAEIARLYADVQRDIQRYAVRLVHFQVVPRHAVMLEMPAQAALEVFVNRRTAESIGRDEHGVPAAGPAECRRCALYASVSPGHFGVVGGRHRTFLRAECLRRIPARRLDVLRIDATEGRQRIGDRFRCQHRPDQHMCNGLGAHVADGTIPDAVLNFEFSVFFGPAAVAVVAESQTRARIVLHFHDEVALSTIAAEQVATHSPLIRFAVQRAKQLQYLRHRVAGFQ